MRLAGVIVLLALAIGATLVLAGFGGSQRAAYSGTIAFSARSDQPDLFVIRPDGTRLRQLTRDAREEASPAWSPNGKSIAFIATTWRRNRPTSAITVIAASGAKRRVLFRAQADQLPVYDLAWSPNGRRIAFSWFRYPNYQLWLLRLDGSADALTSSSGLSPSWAPDGKRLAYAGSGGIFVTNVRTRKVRFVPGTQKSGCPVWSPDGRWIAVCRNHGSGAKTVQSLDVLSPAGARSRQLLKGGAITPLGWARDSDAILFAHTKDDRALGARELFIVSLHDSRVTPVPGTLGVMSASWHR
jgi:Tol biopolymer transport system component